MAKSWKSKPRERGWVLGGTRVPMPEDLGYRKGMRSVRSQDALEVLDLIAPPSTSASLIYQPDPVSSPRIPFSSSTSSTRVKRADL
jgi:hypothetical protein